MSGLKVEVRNSFNGMKEPCHCIEIDNQPRGGCHCGIDIINILDFVLFQLERLKRQLNIISNRLSDPIIEVSSSDRDSILSR